MKTLLRYFVIAGTAILALSVVSGCSEQTSARPQPGPVAVTAVTLTTQPVTLERELPGRTSPYLIAEVRPQVSGLVEGRLFEEGSMVQAGQPLYQLDDDTYLADVNSAKAALESAKASLESARLSKLRADRLRKTGAISQQDVDDITAAYLEAKANVAVAEATLEGKKISLDDARITAPIAGRIGKSSVTQGALVTANQTTALATIQQLDPLYVDLTRSAAEWMELRRQLASGKLTAVENIPVTLLLDDGSRYPYQGTLTFADVSVNPTTGSFALRAEVPNPEQMLLPGMYVRAMISLGERESAILVPQRGVQRDQKGATYVMLVTEDGVVEQRYITVNQTLGDQWLVDEGVQAGDRVIVSGLQKIRPGTPVTVTGSDTPSS